MDRELITVVSIEVKLDNTTKSIFCHGKYSFSVDLFEHNLYCLENILFIIYMCVCCQEENKWVDKNIDWVSKSLMPAWDKTPCTVSRTNKWKELLMSEQELNIQFEASRISWARRKYRNKLKIFYDRNLLKIFYFRNANNLIIEIH